VVGRLAAHAARVPLVIHTVHGQAFHPYQAGWLNRAYILAERTCARRSHRLFAVAQAMVDQCVAARVAPPEKYRVIYSGMDIDAFVKARPDPELRRRLGIPAGAPVVGKIARLFELKGHEYLIAAAPEIVREFPEVRFLLVGDGTLRGALERDIRARGLHEHFVFAGLVPPAEVCRYTALMDILVHLSLREGLPRTVVQALAAGIPAVGFALDGTPEVILDGRTGALCPPSDVPAVRDAVLGLLRDPLRRKEMGANGRAFVQDRFSWRRMADLIEAQYLECLASHAG
jgi:glycosyltransferase involved in cell wall biosynthesis